jgi:hypothetical protein
MLANLNFDYVTKQVDGFTALSSCRENDFDCGGVTIARNARANPDLTQAEPSKVCGRMVEPGIPGRNAAFAATHPVHHHRLPYIQRHAFLVVDAQIGVGLCGRGQKDRSENNEPEH